MKLPNFLFDGQLNSLRSEMGAPLCQSFEAQRAYVPIDLPIAEVLRAHGLDVNFEDIKRLKDGTLGYKGHRVLLYIRDVASYDSRATLPKFHIAYCSTLERMRQEQRFQRYVVANRDDGKFSINDMSVTNEAQRPRVVALDVCQFCLGMLDWNGFSQVSDRAGRVRFVRGFSLQDFFSKYPRDLVSVRPDHTADTAPLNEYTQDWPEISERVKRTRGYLCARCSTVLSLRLGKYLHVHHRNGLKYDNSDRNLEVLCIGCHAEEPMHGHMKSLPEYRQYLLMKEGF